MALLKHIFMSSLLLLTNPLGLFSIHFDEYCDSDESAKTDCPCITFSSKSYLIRECYAVTFHALRDGVPNHMCLAPGCISVFQSINFKNISFYNNKLIDLLPCSPKYIETVKHSNENVTNDNQEQKDKLLSSGNSALKEELSKNYRIVKHNHRNDKVLSRSHEDIISSGTKLMSATNRQGMQTRSLKSNSSELPREFQLRLRYQYTFLLLNSTIEEPLLKSNITKIYEALKNSDVSKLLVRMLQEKLKTINEKENFRAQNKPSISFSTILSPGSITNAPKLRNWHIVRKFFLDKNKSKTGDTETNQSKLKESFINNEKGKYIIPKKLSKTWEGSDSTLNDRDMMSDFNTDSSLNFLYTNNENDEIQNTFNERSDDVLEYFNIKLPYNVEQPLDLERSEIEFNHTTGTPNKGVDKALSRFEDEKEKLNLSSYNTKRKFIEPKTKRFDKSTTKKYSNDHFVSVPLKKSMSRKLSEKLTNLFIWHTKSNSPEEKESLPLNERFLLTLNSNSKTSTKTHSVDLSESTKIDENDSDSYHSSGDPVSSETEDLYNSSIVFVMHKRNITGSENGGKWNSLLSFFHIAKAIPCPKGKNPCIHLSNRSCSLKTMKFDEYTQNSLEESVEFIRKNVSELTIPKIIHLPESLMPEALEGRQFNNTEFMFGDDSYAEDVNTFEDHNETSSRFFFFFK